MNRKLIIPALFISTAALAHETTLLEQLRYPAYRFASMPSHIAVKYQMDNIKPDEFGELNRWYPYAGEEGQFTAVRFTPSVGMGVQEISFTAPNSTKAGVTCTVSDDRIVNLFVSSSTTLSNTAVPDVSVIVPGQPGVADSQVLFDVVLNKALWVDKGDSVFVAIEHPGTYPNVGCLTVSTAGPDDKEAEFWSYATDVPYDWTGWEDIGFTLKPLVTISGYVVL